MPPKTATAEKIPITLAPGLETKPFLEPIKMRRTYRIDDVAKGWKFYKVDFIPADIAEAASSRFPDRRTN